METQTKQIDGGKLYYQLMGEVSQSVNNFIQERIHSLDLTSDLEQLLLVLPKKRENKKVMRPTLSYLVYKTLGGQDSIEKLTPMLAISELNNYYCYLDNWILDNKNEIGSDLNKIRNVTIASQILRDLTQKIIEETNIEEDKKRKISNELAKTTIKCYEGQFKDLQMTTKTISNYSSEEDYLRAYLEKSRLQSGYLYGLSGEIGAILANANEDQRKIGKEICDTLGTGIHISNDLGDFTIFQEQDGSFKLYQDQMADIINDRMTFPSYYALNHGTEEEKTKIKEIIGKKNATNIEKLEVSKAILDSGAYAQTKKILSGYFHEYKRLVHQLPQSPERNALSTIGEVMKYNKYLNEFRKLKQEKIK